MRERTPTPFRDSTPNPPLLKCSLLARAPKYAVCLGQGIKFFFNPVTMTFFLESIFIVLYFGDFKNSDVIHVHLCKLHNMMLPPMVTIVGLYGIFRQKRPTLKYDHGTYKRIGTIYGMPSGDAFFAGAICSLLIDKTPLFSIFIVVAVCYSRTIVGYHNIMQVLVGAILGIILEISMKFIPTDTFVIWNWITTIFLPLIIFFDKNFEIVEKMRL